MMDQSHASAPAIRFEKERWWHSLTRAITSSGMVASSLSHVAHHIDGRIIKRSKGRHSLSTWVAGVPIVTLTTIGAKSGQPRTMPLVAVPNGEKVILIASNWGGAKNPAWYYNLRANPTVTLSYKGHSALYVARELTGAARTAAWEKAVATYSGYASYATRAGARLIPVIELTPQAGA